VKSQVRICMVGAGRVGRNHSRALVRHVPNGKIVALVDPVQAVRIETAADFDIENQYDNLEQALEKTDFDAVVITTPTPTHLPITALAAEHGKHVFLEKPMALNLEQCAPF
jgi:myo-inositol 2-dehydrogenase/D-chiro-inositol 1-dehydrogenase